MVQLVWQGRNLLGEAPVWDPRHQCLIWSDILKAELHQLNFKDDTHRRWQLDAPVCALSLHKRGGLIGTNHHQFIHIELPGMEITPLTEPLFDDTLMFNDGHCAPDGSFVAGAKHSEETQGLAPLFRLDQSLRTHTIEQGYTVANGIEWSPDGQFLYVADSPNKIIYRYDFDVKHGRLSNKQPFIKLTEQEGLADSFAIDQEGCLWNAQFAGNCVKRYSPQGEAVETVELPVSFPTVCCFGGSDMRTLFITTATRDLSPSGLENEPWSGSVLSIRTAVPGQQPRYFQGS